MKLIERPLYLERLKRLKGTPDIKIITGMRRAGKSELLRSFISYLRQLERQLNEPINLIVIDFANLEFDELKSYKRLYQHVESRYIPNQSNILIIDEVQLCPQFELAINSFQNSQKYDIYLTGSNAFLLSSDLATLFTGRFIEIPVFPFSFNEYCVYYDLQPNQQNLTGHLEAYLRQGGLAGSYVYAEKTDALGYLKNVYTTLIKRDLVDKYSIRELALLDNLVEFLMDNIGNFTTANSISDLLNKQKVETNHATIGNYIKYLCNAFMFYKIKRYDIKGKKYLETNDKYYLSDVSLRYALLGTRNIDYGRVYENIVALELLRRGYDIFVGKLYQKEVDFVAMRADEKIYIQVADDIGQKTTQKRELEPLLSIRDAYPKMLLANTKHPVTTLEGVRVLDIARWLLGDEN